MTMMATGRERASGGVWEVPDDEVIVRAEDEGQARSGWSGERGVCACMPWSSMPTMTWSARVDAMRSKQGRRDQGQVRVASCSG